MLLQVSSTIGQLVFLVEEGYLGEQAALGGRVNTVKKPRYFFESGREEVKLASGNLMCSMLENCCAAVVCLLMLSRYFLLK